VAKQFLRAVSDIKIEAWVQQIHEVSLDQEPENLALTTEFAQAVRCPDPIVAEKMYRTIDQTRKAGDSVGGVIQCRVRGMVAGLGEPLYEKLPAVLSSAMMSINAVKGFEIGSGFAGTRWKGSQHNDIFYHDGERIRTQTNHSGGVQGGISNGEPLRFRVAFKPTATIMQDQESVDHEGKKTVVKGKGRHDPCVVPRAVPIVEGMAALVLADQLMLHRARYWPELQKTIEP
jgi:chorismate synthase